MDAIETRLRMNESRAREVARKSEGELIVDRVDVFDEERFARVGLGALADASRKRPAGARLGHLALCL